MAPFPELLRMLRKLLLYGIGEKGADEGPAPGGSQEEPSTDPRPMGPIDLFQVAQRGVEMADLGRQDGAVELGLFLDIREDLCDPEEPMARGTRPMPSWRVSDLKVKR